MATTNGKIERPVGLRQDAYPAVGQDAAAHSGSLDYVNANGYNGINIWSYFKPIRCDKIGNLIRTRVGGVATDFEKAHFGLVPPSGIAGAAVHSYDFGYEPPIPGVHPCRENDWEGYDPNAKPSDYLVSFNDKPVVNANAGKDAGLVFHIQSYFRRQNAQTSTATTSVDLNYVINNMPNFSGELMDLWPCVVLTRANAETWEPLAGDGFSWIRCLNERTSGAPRKLGQYGSNGSGGVFLDWYLPLTDMPTYLNAAGKAVATVWLSPSDKVAVNGPSGGEVSINGQWQDANVVLSGFALPFGTNLKLTLSDPEIISKSNMYVTDPHYNDSYNSGKATVQLQTSPTSMYDESLSYWVIPNPSGSYYYPKGNSSSRTPITYNYGKVDQLYYDKTSGSAQPVTAMIRTNLTQAQFQKGYVYVFRFGLSTEGPSGIINAGFYTVSKEY